VRVAGAHGASLESMLAAPSTFDGVSAVVHSAAVRHRHGVGLAEYRASNIDLVERLMRAIAGRVGRFVYISSVGVYGFPSALPISEGNSFAPRTLYSATKVEAEKLVRRLALELGIEFTILRPTIFYGEGDTNGMLDKLARMIAAGTYRIVGDGTNILHHTHIDDVVDATLLAVESPLAANDDFIVAGPETITLEHLSEMVAQAIGKRVPRLRVPIGVARGVATAIDVLQYSNVFFLNKEPPINNEKIDVMALSVSFDGSKARRFGFEPRVGYREGLRRTLKATL